MRKSYKFTTKNQKVIEFLDSLPRPFRGMMIEAMLCVMIGAEHALADRVRDMFSSRSGGDIKDIEKLRNMF